MIVCVSTMGVTWEILVHNLPLGDLLTGPKEKLLKSEKSTK